MSNNDKNNINDDRNVGLVKKDEVIIASEPQPDTTSKDTNNKQSSDNVNSDGEIKKTDTSSDTTTETLKIDEILTNIQKLNTIATSLNSIRNSTVELNTIYEELVYFNRMVRPLVDTMYYISLSTQGMALASQALNNINLAKPKQVEAGISLTYDLIQEVTCIFEYFKSRMDCYLTLVDNDGC